MGRALAAAHQHAQGTLPGGGGRGVPRGRRARRLGVAGRSIITWDLVRERRVAQHTQRVGSINAFELHRADGRDATRMVSVGQDRSLSFWDLMEDRALQVVPGAHARGVHVRARSRRWASSPRARRTRA